MSINALRCTEVLASATQPARYRCNVRNTARAAFGRKAPKGVLERSAAVNEELLLFFYKVDLGTRLQRALNLEQYDAAQEFRKKISEVEDAMHRQQDEKKKGHVSSQAEVTDNTATGLQLRSELQRAIEEERYQDAASLRDRLSEVEASSLAAQASLATLSIVEYEFRLGQQVVHTEDSWRGVVCGFDPMCCESDSWVKETKADAMARGLKQPFYQVLVDARDSGSYDVAYVAEERLLIRDDSEQATSEASKEVEHPYTYLLFFGQDSKGDYIPTRNLREKYSIDRWDDEDEEEEEVDEEEDDGSGGDDKND
eukprot:gene2145-2848_t